MSDAFDLSRAIVHNSPTPAWPVTAALTRLECRADGVHVEFSKKDGPDRWPDVQPHNPDGSPWVNPDGTPGLIQYTLWLGMWVAGAWHVAGLIEYWHELNASGGNIVENDQIRMNWTYDCGPMARQPVPGERVAFFVTAGSARKKDAWKVHERSQVVTLLFPAKVPAVFEFNAPVPVPEPPTPIPEPPAPSPEPAPPVDLGPFLAHLDALEARLKARIDGLEQRMQAHEAMLLPVYPPLPDYIGTGRVLWQTVTVRSKPVV